MTESEPTHDDVQATAGEEAASGSGTNSIHVGADAGCIVDVAVGGLADRVLDAGLGTPGEVAGGDGVVDAGEEVGAGDRGRTLDDSGSGDSHKEGEVQNGVHFERGFGYLEGKGRYGR